MAALTAPRSTVQYGGSPFGVMPETLTFDIAAHTTIFQGSLVTVNAAGDAQPSAAGLTGVCVGRCEPGNGGVSVNVNATGSAAGSVTVREGAFLWSINGALTKANFGALVYCFDDQTVTATSEATIAGTFLGLDTITGSQAVVLTTFINI